MDETVRVEFDPPRECAETPKSWRLWGAGVETIALPKSHVQLLEREGEMVVAVIMSAWLAEKEGLASSASSLPRKEDDEMTRDDWWLLGLSMAFVFRGERDPVFEAGKLMRKLRGEESL